jgi:hypothetical protein
MQSAKNHDGRAFAHPSRSQRCYPLLGTRIKSAVWHTAGSGLRAWANLTLAILTSGRTKRERSDSNDTAAAAGGKLKRTNKAAAAIWG